RADPGIDHVARQRGADRAARLGARDPAPVGAPARRRGGLRSQRFSGHTVHAMLSLTFGDDVARQRTLDTIRGIHRRVNGVLPESTGCYPSGTRYSAEDPDLVLWVHETLIES